jgi:hypothetical protein
MGDARDAFENFLKKFLLKPYGLFKIERLLSPVEFRQEIFCV